MLHRIRPARASDAPACWRVFYRAVHEGTGRFYSETEQQAWMPTDQMPDTFVPRLMDHITFVATGLRGVQGFMTMGRDGHIDLAYVLPQVMGRGVAAKLYDRLVQEARALGLPHMDTEASFLARRFFEKRGWQVDARQSVIRNGVAITNFRMSCKLDDQSP